MQTGHPIPKTNLEQISSVYALLIQLKIILNARVNRTLLESNVLSELENNKASISSECPNRDVQLYQQSTSVLDTLQRYSSLVGFSVGNGVVLVQSAELTKDVAFSRLQSAMSRRPSRPKNIIPPWKSITLTKTLMKLHNQV
jgi:hypothetical protein